MEGDIARKNYQNYYLFSQTKQTRLLRSHAQLHSLVGLHPWDGSFPRETPHVGY